MAFFSNTLQAAKAAYKHGLEAIDVEKQAIQAKAVLKTAKQALSEVRSEEPKSEGGIKASAPSSGYVPPSTTRQRPSHVVKIMLVGAPGHGKSRLGSFLVSPDDTMDVHDTNCKTAFEFSAQTGAFTQDISSHQAVIDGTTFEFVDTPGFGENPAKDLKHSLQAVRYLLKAEEISAVVFAFSGRFENEGRELVKFLKKLLGDRVIQTNLLLVVTNVSQCKEAQKDRLRDKQPLSVLMAQYQAVVQQEFGLKTPLPVIDIDTRPGTENEAQIAQFRRMEICRFAESLPLAKVFDLTIPKRAELIADDEKKQRQLEKAIDDLQNSLHTANKDEIKTLRELQELTTEVKVLDIKLQGLCLELDDIGSDELEKCGYQSGSRGPQLFLPEPLCIDVDSKTVVDSYTTHVRDLDDEVKVKKLSDTNYRMTVEPYSTRLGTCEAWITLYAKRKDIHATAVKQLKARIKEHEDLQAKVRLRVGKLIEENDFVREQFSQKIQAEIAAAQKEIARLSKDTMSVEEAVQRLTALDLELQKCNNTA